MLSLQRGKVQLAAYTPLWTSLFDEERERLTGALGTLAFDIQHIGSTAVPGLAAKPLLDIGVAVAAEADISACIPLLEGLGYTYRGDRGASEGHFFDRGTDEKRTHYLHLLIAGSPGWLNDLKFRDRLRTDASTREAYLRPKNALASTYADERASYTAAKAEFIQRVLAENV